MQSSFSGPWQFRFEDEPSWRPIAVPGCWEALADAGIDRAGPAWYRTRFVAPALPEGGRAWLRFGAVSYDCAVFVNGRSAGSHRGLWDAFAVEITGLCAPGAPAELLLCVEKPVGLVAGPESDHRPGRFPLRETLSGFLPYVWGQIFGGVWQDVALAVTGRTVFDDVWVRGDADGRVLLEADLSAPDEVRVELIEPGGGTVVASTYPASEGRLALTLHIPDARPWSPAAPALYTARLSIADGDERVIRFGLRTLRAEGAALRLNGSSLFPRLALSWGCYPDSLHSNPGPQRVRADLERLRALGYNGVKLCLWFPPPYYFDLADELGMLLWVELPLWLPQVTPPLRAQIVVEYERLVRQARQHPAVILYSLGCELDADAGADLLGPLYQLVKGLAGDALVRDNSGSGEAYGGLLDEFADYDDHHFYAEIQHLGALLDRFAPRWRRPRPWLLGECCDSDTFRDPRQLGPDADRPWWMADSPARNPQGARWRFDLPAHAERLRAADLWERADELGRIALRQAMLYRKHTIELLRADGRVGGYVISGEADTPVTTAGMWDNAGALKFDPEEFRAFNADLVLLAGWGRRRAWVAGGDRPAFWDTWGYPSGEPVRAYLIASDYREGQGAGGRAELDWEVSFVGEPPFASGSATVALVAGSVCELAVAAFAMPEVATPRELVLRAELRAGGRRAANAWPLWAYPRAPWRGLGELAIVDPTGRLADLAIDTVALTSTTPAVIATAWTPEVADYVDAGGKAVLLQAGAGPAGPLPTEAMPFWREAIRIIEPHPSWGDFPHSGWAGLPFYGCACDFALDLAGTAAVPILRRLDARTMALHAYVAELPIGRGRAIISTLRMEGGQGDQPSGIAQNTAAAYLLQFWMQYLISPEEGRA